MLKIGVDIDGVLADFLAKARTLLKEMCGKPADDLIQTGWGFDSLGITKEEERQFWDKLDTIPNWWYDLPKMPGTDTIKRLCDKYRVIFITNRKDGTGMPVDVQSAAWLQWTFGINYPTVLLSDDKGPLARALKLDWFIDDRPKNVEEVRVSSPLTRTVLYRTSYNTEYAHLDCVKTFDEFTKRFSLPEEEVLEPLESITSLPELFVDADGNISTRELI
jgi:5'(3')-deoxyribonucleotidase